jgi:hypothetical protein
MTSKITVLLISFTLVLSGVALSLWVFPPITGAQSVSTSDVTSGTDGSYTTIYVNVSDSGHGSDGVTTSQVVTTTVYSLSVVSVTLPAQTFTETVTRTTTVVLPAIETTTIVTSTLTPPTVTKTIYVTGSTIQPPTSMSISCSNCASLPAPYPGEAPGPRFFLNYTLYPSSGSTIAFSGLVNASGVWSMQFPLGTTLAIWEVAALNSDAQFSVTIGGASQPIGLVPTTFPLGNGTLVSGYGDSGTYP